eukprot:GGOE01053654.1.p1 GENE.GGOE01053654.1~~GGOE01053654.1.p1  ORF type:complete len:382 (+),score=144.51 GGOE01053654.1:496-1641(+)
MEYELPLLKVPVECMQKLCRAQQRNVDKDFLVVENAVKNLMLREKDDPNVENTCSSIDKIVNKLRGVKRKLQEFDEVQVPQAACQARLEHLHQFHPARACVFGDSYNVTRVNRIIIDYLLRRGHIRTAEALCQRYRMEALVDIDLFRGFQAVIDSLRRHSCTEALAWCKENQARLKKLKSTFELHLRMQEFIELAGANRKVQAVEYARKHLAPYAEQHLEQIKFCMAALCYDRTAPLPKYQELVDGSRWDRLVEEFRQDLLAVYQFSTHPLLHVALQAGILALNTHQVYQQWSYNVDDPMCNKLFQQLARRLPLTCKKNSSLVCRISGSVMDSNNPPVVLPNGQVYSFQTLEAMQEAQGYILCPATQERFQFHETCKAFVL